MSVTTINAATFCLPRSGHTKTLAGSRRGADPRGGENALKEKTGEVADVCALLWGKEEKRIKTREDAVLAGDCGKARATTTNLLTFTLPFG